MKGLLYREWILMRRQFLLTLGGLGILALLMFLTLLSQNIGNLSRLEDLDALKTTTYILFSVFLPLFLFLFMAENPVHSSDIESGFQQLRYTLPVTALQFVGAKYLIRTAVFAGAWILSLLWGQVITQLDGAPEDAKVTTLGCICIAAFAGTLTMALKDPVLLLTRTRRQMMLANSLLAVLPMTLLYGGAGGVMLYETKQWTQLHGADNMDGFLDALAGKYAPFLDHFTVIALVGSVLLLILSFGLSYLAVKRRDR